MMNKNNIYIIPAILLACCLSILCSAAVAEEIDNLSIPLNDEEELFPLTLRTVGPSGERTDAILTLTGKTTGEKKSYLVTSEKQLTLPRGEYQLTANAGMRRTAEPVRIIIPDNKDVTITIKPFANIEPTGWMMLDSFYNPPSAISRTAILNLATALELRTILTPLNNILSSPESFTELHARDTALLAPVTAYMHPDYGAILSFDAAKPQASPYNPVILDKALYPLLNHLKDNNRLTALSPVIYTSADSRSPAYSEEFIFDTIGGPLYDLFILDNFSSSLKIWHTLLNLGYRIPAIYTGGNNFHQKIAYPSTKLYAKIPRKEYSQKYLYSILKSGKFILSNGPFIRFFTESIGSRDKERQTGKDGTDWINVNSLKIGDVGFTSPNLRNIYAEAFSSSAPADRIKAIELIYNGKVIEKKIPKSPTRNISCIWKVVLDKPGWVQLRYISANGLFHAVTNPTYLIDYNTRPLTPALARSEIHVVDASTDRAIPARIDVENYGIIIDSVKITDHAILLQTPATASITVTAEGYRSQTKGVYLDGGSAAYIQTLKKKKLLPKAFINQITYNYLAKALQNSRLIFKMHKD